ncbi:hypothetical protein MWU54_01560 [Marivita sp. S6314]|uniref:hypothetical protein n=1 Tax=Marivita sp. S6314 TaxID=2926406 RepID=UPI001FF40AD5|nr:hypothetical protein [Marivita sp. S6314]MCK0148695.1 hypothetical protein [Marivita sp. S6314]
MNTKDWAMDAVSHTRREIANVPANKWWKAPWDLYKCVDANRKTLGSPSEYEGEGLKFLKATAALAEKKDCGNCREFSASTFMYLVNAGYLGSIEWAQYKDGDHAFVVLNRAETTDGGAPLTWGKDCWIADSWGDRVVQAKDYWDDMPGFKVYAPRIRFRYTNLNRARLESADA